MLLLNFSHQHLQMTEWQRTWTTWHGHIPHPITKTGLSKIELEIQSDLNQTIPKPNLFGVAYFCTLRLLAQISIDSKSNWTTSQIEPKFTWSISNQCEILSNSKLYPTHTWIIWPICLIYLFLQVTILITFATYCWLRLNRLRKSNYIPSHMQITFSYSIFTLKNDFSSFTLPNSEKLQINFVEKLFFPNQSLDSEKYPIFNSFFCLAPSKGEKFLDTNVCIEHGTHPGDV